MLLKLLKYDIKSIALKMLTVFGVFAFVCILMPPFIGLIQKNFAIDFMALTIPIGAMALCILVIVFIFQRYRNNLYGSEGYLMFTLPIKGRYLLVSKLITAFLWITVGFILGCASIISVVFALTPVKEIVSAFNEIMSYSVINFSTISLAIVMYVISMVQFILQVFFAITVSKLPIWRKFGVIVGVLTFLAINYLGAIPQAFVSPSNNYEVRDGFAIKMVVNAISRNFTWSGQAITIIIGLVLTIGLFIATTALIEKSTSLK